MVRSQFLLDVHDELIIDNFAGGGGASTGIEQALGRHVDVAINHDPLAVALHKANHPQTDHLCEDVFHVCPGRATAGRRVGFGWFSPDCTDFSKAKGGKPRSKKIRGLAWVLLRWCAHPTASPRVLTLENVEEFLKWGPLTDDGKRCPLGIGRTFNAFISCLTVGIDSLHPDLPEIAQFLGADFDLGKLGTGLGYKAEWKELRGCDYGAPTTRKRLYLILRRDGKPIVWPSPTHANPKLPGFRATGLKPWRIAAECIDWSIPCPSIFLSKQEARKLGVRRPLAEATQRRIAKGVFKFVIDAKEPFLVQYHSPKREGDERLASLDVPLPTQDTSNRFGLAVPFVSECANASNQRNMPIDEAMRTICAEVKGGHFALVSAFLAKHFGGHETPGGSLADGMSTVTARDHHWLVAVNLSRHFGESVGGPLDAPLPTIMPDGAGKTAVVASHVSKLYGTSTGHDIATPLHSITANGNHLAEVRAFLTKYHGNEKDGVPLTDPLSTISTRDRLALVTVNGEPWAIWDIGIRMLVPRELYRGQGFPENYIIEIEVDVFRQNKWRRVPLSQEAQVRMCGNSVCPPVASAIVSANVPELAVWRNGERRRFDAYLAQLTRSRLFAA